MRILLVAGISVFSMFSERADAVVVDLNALTNSALNPIEVLLPAGNHLVAPVRSKYVAWHARDGVNSECDADGRNCYHGWLTIYSVASPVDGGFQVVDNFTGAYATPDQAFEEGAVSTLFVSDGINPTRVYLPDSFVSDNIEGLSLEFTDAPSGATELEPLLPTDIVDGRFEFTFQSELALLPLWFDPEIAVGYEYQVFGADFAEITAPSFGSVPDADGYVIDFGAGPVDLMAGETVSLPDNVNFLRLLGIDVELMLSPDDAMAFPTGFSFRNVTDDFIRMSQTPLSEFVGPAPIPLPAPWMLLGAALLLLGAPKATGNRRS